MRLVKGLSLFHGALRVRAVVVKSPPPYESQYRKKMMQKPKSGDTVRVHYTGTLDDGTQFDTSRGKEPMEFAMGQGQLIAGFEKAVADLVVGESCTVTLPPAEGYGDINPDMIQEVPRKLMPEGVELEAGMVLQGKADDGRVDNFTVVSFTEESVTLDGNHPLAGKALTFDIELLEIV